MSETVRVQLSRKAGWRMPANTVKVDRASGFGNRYRVTKAHPGAGVEWWVVDDAGCWTNLNGDKFTKESASAFAVELFRKWVTFMGEDYAQRARLALKGKNLACWCKPGTPCHADVLLELANSAPVNCPPQAAP